jgi:predicted NBD/HSP70 family sugar kinase
VKVGIDLGGTKLLMVAESPGGPVVSRVATGSAFGPADLEGAILAFLATLKTAPDALGIAFPGLVAEDGSVVACDVLPRLVGWRASPAVAGPWRFAILNDCEAALVAEADGDPRASLAVVVVGTGIGAAFQVDGRVLRGARGWAGELGSIPIAAGGGVVRTLDQMASGQAIVERAGGDGAALERLAAQDARIAGIVREAGTALGLGLAAVLHILNPAVVALGGGVWRLPGYAEAALASARAHTLPAMWEACAIRSLRDGEQAAALGAARAAASRP